MTTDALPWLSHYDPGKPASIEPEHASALAMFEASVKRVPDAPLVHYFDATLTVGDVDAQSDALACALLDLGLTRGDRVAICLQNVPEFPVAVLATWKAGGIVVPVGPMLKERELRGVLIDSGTRVLVTHDALHRDVAAKVLSETEVRAAITIPEPLPGNEPYRADGTLDLATLVERFEGREPPAVELRPDDVALLTYTSGTTGPSKGAMNTHGNVVFASQTYRDWAELGQDDVCLAVAPLSHITGLVAHLTASLLVPMPMVLPYRFDPVGTAGLVERWGATFTVASITVFIALMNDERVTPAQLATLRKLYSGGAPVPPSVAQAWEDRFGTTVRIAYGLTETTSPSLLTPLRGRSPVDARASALSVGLPVFGTVVRVLGENAAELPPGEVGEIAVSGPQVVPGYWNQPEESAAAIVDGELRTGDVGFMDDRGWVFVVDRKKDQINASGYKVWPREVEDVLYEHPAVREAAVVGVADEYRGETVKAFVSLKPGRTADPDELVTFCRSRLAAYKYPRQVELLDELPKTGSGKILRRQLRGATNLQNTKEVGR